MACHGLVSGSLSAALGKHTCSQSPRWAGSGVFSAKRSGLRGSQSGLHHVQLPVGAFSLANGPAEVALAESKPSL